MNTYYVEFNGIEYYSDNYESLINAVEADLCQMGGGHANIYDEDGNFIDDVEVV